VSDYDATKLAVNAVYDAGVLGVGRLGSMRLGTVVETLAPLQMASVTVSGGYQVGALGEMTPDPVVASGSLSTYGKGSPDVDASPLAPGTFVQISYDGARLFNGLVSSVSTSVEASTDPRGEWVSKVDWSTLSSDANLLGITVTWNALPAEGALQRLSRWFTVNTEHVAPQRQALLYEPHAAQGSGTGTLLDLLRAFTERTLLAVRIGVPVTTVTVLDRVASWDGVPPAPMLGTEDASSWAHAGQFASQTRIGQLTLTGPDFPQSYPNEPAPTPPQPPPQPTGGGPDVPLAPTTTPGWSEKPGDDGEPPPITVEVVPDSIWQQQQVGPGYGDPDTFEPWWRWAQYSDQEISSGTYANMNPSYWSRTRAVAVFDISKAVAAAGGTSVRAARVRIWPSQSDTGAQTNGTFGTGVGTNVSFSLYSGQAPTVRGSDGKLRPTALGDGPAVASWQMSEVLDWAFPNGHVVLYDPPPVDLDLPGPGSVLALTLGWYEAVSVPDSGDNSANVALNFQLFIDVDR
jgi:hypothetical protein